MSRFTRLRLSRQTQQQLSYGMTLCLVGLFFVGLERGSIGVIVNTLVALAVTQLPTVLERDYGLPMDPRLTLWITSAAFLHTIGTVGIPGASANLYVQIWWWDHLTHALSASVVAAAGYATVRAIDEHSEAVHIPPRFMPVVILLFVLAFGVLWELLEFALGIAAGALGMQAVLTQYGATDTLKDLLFNSMGGLVVAIWGGIYLSDLSASLAARFGTDRR